jgi:hypothetical protein
MRTCGCQKEEPGKASKVQRLAQHGAEAARWVAPSAALVVVPKCPACLAAYVAMVSGIGISATVAAHLRMIWILLCVMALAALMVRSLKRFAEGGRPRPVKYEGRTQRRRLAT